MDSPISTKAPSPEAVDALYAAGHWLFEQGRCEDAGRLFRAHVLAAPMDERAWLGLGASEAHAGRTSNALKVYAMGAMAIPRGAHCCLAAARLMAAGGEREGALAAFDRAQEIAEVSGDDELLEEILAARRRA